MKTTKKKSAVQVITPVSKSLAKKTDVNISAAVILQKIEKDAAPYFKSLNKIAAVATQEDFDNAGKLIKALKQLSGLADDEEKKITKPLDLAKKNVQALFKPFKSLVLDKETSVKLMMSAFLEKQRALNEKVHEDFRDGKIKKVGTFNKKLEAAEVKTSRGTAVTKQVAYVEITDAKKIPRDYLVIDEALVLQHLKEGIKVPGAELKYRDVIAI